MRVTEWTVDPPTRRHQDETTRSHRNGMVTNYGKKPAVTFDHARHEGVDCAQCHHTAGEGKYKCGECHKSDDEGGVPKIKDAFHKKDVGACYSCHLEKDAEHKRKCSDCHSD